MDRRFLLLTLTLVVAALAGCAENPGTGEGDATPPAPVSNEEAASLFAQAAGDVPDRYGVRMVAAKNGTNLMEGEAVFDEPAETSYFSMKFDPSLMDDASGGFGGSMGDVGEIAMYATPQGGAILVNGTVMLAPPDEDSPFQQSAKEQEGFQALANPDELLGALKDENITVNSVTPTTLRGKGALKIDATFVDEEANHTQDVSIWLFQNPSRVGRVEMAVEAEPGDEADDPFTGATMTMDMLYDNEVDLAVPEGLKRAMGLRYASNRESFGGFGGFGGSGEDEGPEVWTFQVDGGLALSEIVAEVGGAGAMASMGEEGMSAEPEWSMAFSDGTKTQDGITLTFADVDADGTLSANDTLTIERAEDADYAAVVLKDTVSGYRVVPGAGLALLALAAVGVALLSRR